MKHDFNHKAETFDSPKNIFLANLVCQAIEKQIDLLSDKEIKNIQFLEQDLLKKPLGQEFDLIVVCRVLHHMPDLDAALSLFHQHLRENGQLLLADFTKAEANHHGFELSELEKQLIEHGFSSVHNQILYSAEDLFQGNYSELFLTVAQKSLA